MHIFQSALAGLGLAFAVAAPVQSATFQVFESGSATLLGTFEAPQAGGALTAAAFVLEGGTFDALLGGAEAPVYDAGNGWVTGAGGPFGGIANSLAFNTADLFANPITCGIGECVFSMTSSGGGGAPAEWYLDYLPANPADAAPIDFGFYDVQLAPVPLPATALLLLAALGGGLVVSRRRGI
ncbi:MAG: hypothetical protein KJN93_08130 [Alphaproteobacteria bacterium]|nr:hypothetical protein [Alphaproteobacteria bacterium]NNF24458.1 hypothetical protein [Paracoccaceae bacterium]